MMTRNKSPRILLALCLILSGCSSATIKSTDLAATGLPEETVAEPDGIVEPDVVESLEDPSSQETLDYVESVAWASLRNQLPEDAEIISVQANYYPQAYLDRLASNTKANNYFGYTLEEAQDYFDGKPYVFTVDETGQTIVKAMEPAAGLDEEYIAALQDVAIGTGVIVLCVVVSVASGGTATPVGITFAAMAKDAALFGVAAGAIGGIAAGVSEGMETGDFDQVLKAGVTAGARDFKWSIIMAAGMRGVGGAAKAFKAKLPSNAGKVNGQKCVNADLAGKAHPETGVKFEKKMVVNGKGNLVEGVFPRFDAVAKTTLKKGELGLTRSEHNKLANEWLKNQTKTNPELRNKFTKEQLQQIEAGKTPQGLTWHHNEEKGILELVDSATHDATAHTGGYAVWGAASKGAGKAGAPMLCGDGERV